MTTISRHANAQPKTPPKKAEPKKPAPQKTDPKCEYFWGNKNNGYSVKGSGAKVCSYTKKSAHYDVSDQFLNRTNTVSPAASSKIGSIPSLKFNAQPKVTLIKSKGPDGKEVDYKISTHVQNSTSRKGYDVLGWLDKLGINNKEVKRFTKSEQILGIENGKTKYGKTQA